MAVCGEPLLQNLVFAFVDACGAVIIGVLNDNLDAATVYVIYRPSGEDSAVLDEWRGPGV